MVNIKKVMNIDYINLNAISFLRSQVLIHVPNNIACTEIQITIWPSPKALECIVLSLSCFHLNGLNWKVLWVNVSFISNPMTFTILHFISSNALNIIWTLSLTWLGYSCFLLGDFSEQSWHLVVKTAYYHWGKTYSWSVLWIWSLSQE